MTRSSAESHGNFVMVRPHHVRKEERFGSATDQPVRDAGGQVREYIAALAGWRNSRMGSSI